jgi:hypothetical protein
MKGIPPENIKNGEHSGGVNASLQAVAKNTFLSMKTRL